MDVNDLRSIVTVAGLVLFIALVVSTWSRRHQARFDAAARLPFLDDTPTGAEAPTEQDAETTGARRE